MNPQKNIRAHQSWVILLGHLGAGYFFAFLILCCTSSYAQEQATLPSFQFELVDLPGGALGNHCQSIKQDPMGYMWFGTQNGLHRWDGYRFKTYHNDPLDSTSISMSYVEYIYVAEDSSLWLGTWGGGLNHFDPVTEKFTRYIHNPEDPNSISNDFIADILEDDLGNLWIATQEGLNKLDLETGKFKVYKNDPNDSSSLSYDIVRKIYKDSNGDLWIGTGWFFDQTQDDGGLNKYNPTNDNFKVYLHQPGDHTSLVHNKVSEIYEDSKGNFWIGTNGHVLHLMDRKTGTFKRININQSIVNFDKNEHDINELDFVAHLRFMFEDKEEKIWFGFWAGGVKYFDPQTNLIQHYYHKIQSSNSIPENDAWTMFQSKDGTLWASTANRNAKVFKIIPKKSMFGIHTTPFSDGIIGFHEDDSGIQWFSSDAVGLVKIDPFTRDTIHYIDDPLRPTKFSFINWTTIRPNRKHLFQNIDVINEDHDSNLWLGKGFSGGLVKFDPNTGQHKEYLFQENNVNSIGSDEILDILVDAEGTVWVITDSGHINKYDSKKDNFLRISTLRTHLRHGGEYRPDLRATMIYGDNNSIWLASSYIYNYNDGIILSLIEFDIHNYTLKSKPIRLPAFNNTRRDKVNGIRKDDSGNIWVCTYYGLHKFNPKTKELQSKNVQDLGALHFSGITIDAQGFIWLAGNGLIKYDPVKETSYIYKESSGIANLPFQGRSIFNKSNGQILAGTKGALLTFDPVNFKTENAISKPYLRITNFEHYENKHIRKQLTRSVLNEDVIRLRHNQNVFTFEFAILDYLNPSKNLHSFKLENYDENWRTAGHEPVASYVKVPPGEYTFKVRGANHQGVWSDEKSIQVIIHPPWWDTLWAKIAFYSSLLLLIFTVYRFQLNRRLHTAEAKRLKELDTVKTQLYTNITHEFRTPLTVISGMAAQIKENPKEWFNEGLTMIQRNSTRLLDLVNQMLDLSKLENGKMALHLQNEDIVRYLKYLVESFHSFAESKQIQIHFLTEEDEVFMDFDRDKIQQVISNLLSNAVKFTPAFGHIYISVDKEKQPNSSSIKIKIKDTGKGIPEAQIPHIFDRFYQVEADNYHQENGQDNVHHEEGTGIGLALVKELIKLMSGEISVKSKIGKGTEFTINIPIRNEVIEQSTPAQLNEPMVYKKESAPPAILSASTANNPGNQEGKPLVLLVEDNLDVVAYIASCLHKDYQIKVGKDGQEGIDIALKNIPDLIITDVMMPYKDGFEVCATLKRDERTSHIPIIMLTAKADMESKLEGLEKGADAYLAKPFHKAELLMRIKKLLELRQALQQHYCALAGMTTSQASPSKDIPNIDSIENAFIEKARSIVEKHIDDFDFSVDQFCKKIGLSRSQLHRKLSALTGLSSNSFIRYIRLNKAKTLLQNPELSITAVAFDTGFSDPSYFGRVFKKEFNMTPKEWQDQVVEL